MNILELKNKKIAIWGFGFEGKAIYKHLKKTYPDKKVLIFDKQTSDLTINEDQLLNQSLKIDVIIKSPGISPFNEIYKQISKDILITSGSQIWLDTVKPKNLIAITGSKGKSTTSKLLSNLFDKLKIEHKLAGNFGLPLAKCFEEAPEYWILELSSYQLHNLEINPKIGVITNLFPEHLNWHQNKNNYYNDKLNILKNIFPNSSIINFTNENLKNNLDFSKDFLFFNNKDFFHISDNKIYLQETFLLEITNPYFLFKHLQQNIIASLSVLLKLKIDIFKNKEKILEVINEYEPLNFRLTTVYKDPKLIIINDSISTISECALNALSELNDLDKKIHLIIGGEDRGIDQTLFYQKLEKFKKLNIYCLPNTGHKVYELSIKSSNNNFYKCSNLKESILKIKNNLGQNDLILLSPAAPSYNVYKNYIQRGEDFNKLINHLKK